MAIRRRLALGVVIRVLADTVVINVSLVSALAVRFLVLTNLARFDIGSSVASLNLILTESVTAYRNSAWLLTLICLVTFFLSGFYTYGRAYRSRYKFFLVFQAVSVAYLVFGFFSFFLSSSVIPFSPFRSTIPRIALVGSWVLSMVLVAGLRAGSALWRRATWAEAPIWGRPQTDNIRNVTVIGGAGYVGSVLVRELLAGGYHVTVLDSLIYGDQGIKDLAGHKDFSLIRDDFRNIDAVVRALQYADAVVHLGAIVGDPACALDEDLTQEVNLAATRMIAQAARGYGVQRFIFASTCSVYGAGDHLLDERSPLNPISLYARTKIGSEDILRDLMDDRFSPIILRLATVYGLSHRPRFDLVVNLLAAKAASEKSISVFGGEQWRPFVHVEDVADVITRCLERPIWAIKGETFNVGSDSQNYQIKQLGAIIHELMPEVEIAAQEEHTDPRDYRVNFHKLATVLGFHPEHTVADGVLEIRDAIRGGQIQDFRDPRYSNYKTLSDESVHQWMQGIHITSLYQVPNNH